MEVVAFKDGTFGVRQQRIDVGWFFSARAWEYNLVEDYTTWCPLSFCADLCRFSTSEKAKKRVELLTDEGRPVGRPVK